MGRLCRSKGDGHANDAFGCKCRPCIGACDATRSDPADRPNKKQKAIHASLAKLSGAAFDRKFASEMVKDHKKEIAEHQKAAKKQGDPAGTYASETLPTLQKHLETAQALTKATSAR